MKFKGNQPIRETVHPDPDQQPLVYPEPRRFPEDYQTIEEADMVENEQDDIDEINDGDGRIAVEPPIDNVIPFHQPRRRRGPPDHNM
jgi:hypothetical protein